MVANIWSYDLHMHSGVCSSVTCAQGMVDPGELLSLSLQREFSEEALNSLEASPQERKKIYERISKLFSSPGFQVRNDLFRK